MRSGIWASEYGHQAVVESLTDPEDRVRAAAVVVLFERRDAALDRRLAFDGFPGRRARDGWPIAPWASSASADAPLSAANALVRQLSDEPLAEQDMAAFDQLIGGSDENGALFDLLAEALGDQNEYVGDRAAQLLMRLAPSSVEVLIGCLPDPAAGRRAALGAGPDQGHTRPAAADRRPASLRGREHARRAAPRSASCAILLRSNRCSQRVRIPDFTVRAGAGSALNVLGTVAVVVGVSATLLRPELANPLEATNPSPPRGGAAPDDRRPARGADPADDPRAGGGPARGPWDRRTIRCLLSDERPLARHFRAGGIRPTCRRDGRRSGSLGALLGHGGHDTAIRPR